MVDLLLVAGSALGVLSVLMAVVAVIQTRAPRGAAIALMLAIILFLLGAKMDPSAINPVNLGQAWQRLFAGEISLSEAPVAEDTPAAQAPAGQEGAGAAGNAAPAP